MTDHKRTKKKRGRRKLFMSCFRSFDVNERPNNIISKGNNNNNSNNNNSDSPSTTTGQVLVAQNGCKEDDVIHDVNFVNANVHGRSRSVSRLVKEVLFDSVMVKKICSFSKSSTTSDSFSSIQKTIKQSKDIDACGIASTDIEDSSSRCSTLLSSSSRATSYSHSSSSSSSTNSTSRWLSEPKTSSPLDKTDTNNHISSHSSLSQKPNPILSGSQPDSTSLPLPLPLTVPVPLPLPKSNSLHKSSSCNKGLSQLDSYVSKTSVSTNPEKIKHISNNSNILWCLFFLLSLIVLVVYGRIYAILCTSIWFYLVPCRRVKRVIPVSNDNKALDTESEQYKKRVIMAGLLDRTRNPLR